MEDLFCVPDLKQPASIRASPSPTLLQLQLQLTSPHFGLFLSVSLFLPVSFLSHPHT
jgi:hypothetical protein